MTAIRLTFYPRDNANAAVKLPGGAGKKIHAIEDGKTLCGNELEGYALAEADLDPEHSDVCKDCADEITPPH